MSPSPFVHFNHVSKRYGKGPLILDDLDLQVNEGDFVSLIGPSGCGKSTLLKLLAGLSPITEGELLVDAMEPKDAREELFYIFQEANLLPWLRVLQNVELPLKIRGDAKDRRRERARHMVELVGLKHASRHFPWQLSGGMRMRVSIARALSMKPKILLLDEPFGALDEMTRDRLNEDLLLIREQDPFTAFFVTHSVAEAVFLSNRIVVLSANPGRIADIIEVPFDYPRKAELRESSSYLEVLAKATHALRSVITEA